jgi:hypothetical protein
MRLTVLLVVCLLALVQGRNPESSLDAMQPRSLEELNNIASHMPSDTRLIEEHGTSSSLDNPNGAHIPVLPKDDPCVALCDFDGGWKTLPCQECILRGLINGWLLFSQGSPGYNYNRWARDLCVHYMAQKAAAFEKGSFSKCYFDQVHLACNH